MKWYNKKIYERIFLGSIIMFFVILVLIGLYGDYKIENKPLNYAIGEIIDYKAGARVAPWFDYEFYLNGERIEGSFSIVDKLRRESHDSLRKYIGKKYFVKFVIDNHNTNRLMFDHPPVWEGLKQPPEGWDGIPSYRFKKENQEQNQ